MKRTLLFSAFFFPSFFLFAADFHGQDLDGRYVATCSGQAYEIEMDRHTLFLKRGHYGQWDTFKQVGHRLFQNRRGHEIYIADDRTLKYRKTGMAVILKKERSLGHGHQQVRSGHWAGHDLEGQWLSRSGKHRAFVVPHNRGISVNFSGKRHSNREFFRFDEDWGRYLIFINDRGDTITFDQYGQMVWRDRRGRRDIKYRQR